MNTIDKDGNKNIDLDLLSPIQISYNDNYTYDYFQHYNTRDNIDNLIKRTSSNECTIDPTLLTSILHNIEDSIYYLTRRDDQSTATINNSIHAFDHNFKVILNEMGRSYKLSYIHNCAGCGHPLEIEENQGIFHCKYCGSTYVLGPERIYSTF